MRKKKQHFNVPLIKKIKKLRRSLLNNRRIQDNGLMMGPMHNDNHTGNDKNWPYGRFITPRTNNLPLQKTILYGYTIQQQ